MNFLGRSDVWLVGMLMIAILISAFFAIDTAYQTRQMYSKLQELRVGRDRLIIEWGRLMLERGAISADMRIDTLARREMTLRSPSDKQIIMMERPK